MIRQHSLYLTTIALEEIETRTHVCCNGGEPTQNAHDQTPLAQQRREPRSHLKILVVSLQKMKHIIPRGTGRAEKKSGEGGGNKNRGEGEERRS